MPKYKIENSEKTDYKNSVKFKSTGKFLISNFYTGWKRKKKELVTNVWHTLSMNKQRGEGQHMEWVN